MKVDDFIEERGAGVSSYGIVIACGPKTYDVVWIGGSTTRYRHGVRSVRVVTAAEIGDGHLHKHLLREAKDAKAERRRGAGIRRGTVSPSR